MIDCGCGLESIYRQHLCFVDVFLVGGDSKSIAGWWSIASVIPLQGFLPLDGVG
jgi:hypothetical protein